MTAIRVDYAGRKIILSSAFEKRAFTPGTVEYETLQSVRALHPGFALATRQFKKNTKQEHYRGLSYDYMRDYISAHEENPAPVLFELNEMIGVSKAHSLGKRYPTIKGWFLERYPAVKEFGLPQTSIPAKSSNTELEDAA